MTCVLYALTALTLFAGESEAPAPRELPRAFVHANDAGWIALGASDFTNVNCHADTWRWKDGVLYCTGKPTGVLRSVRTYTNLEMVVEWCHRRHAGNSGVFVWTTEASITRLAERGKPGLPKGIEVQVLDPGYEENWKQRHNGQAANWFTSHGDVFPVGVKMTPFPPVSANGSRSFPAKRLVKAHGNWNHYYIRAINGEVRLWVNGEEVSGGNNCRPSSGYLCLESEGAPVEFRNIRIRTLP
jgi:hypothetical protein